VISAIRGLALTDAFDHRLAFQWQVADLVDDEQVVALQAPELVVQRVAVLGVLEAVDPLLGGGEPRRGVRPGRP
jgi:hypothetical protein